MRRHHTSVSLVLIGVLAALAVGCAHTPRTSSESATVLSFRDDYLRANPDGQFNDYIRRGEVTKGMKPLEVLASWGVPDRRVRTEDKSVNTEYWGYLSADEISGDWVHHTFVFTKNELVAWDIVRHVSKNGTLTAWRTDELIRRSAGSELPRPDATEVLKR